MERPKSVRALKIEEEGLRTTVLSWCSYYQLYHQYSEHSQAPISPYTRFGIGVYQLYQAINWEGTDCEYESLAAAIVHFLCTAEGLSLYSHIPTVFTRSAVSKDDNIYKELLSKVGRAQQLLFYCEIGGKTDRSKTRTSGPTLGEAIADLCNCIFSIIPPSKVAASFEHATEIMTERL